MKRINGGLFNTLRELRVEIEKLEKEKANLFKEIEGLKARGKERASTLREEIETLRGEVKVFRKLIDTSPEKTFGGHHITNERNSSLVKNLLNNLQSCKVNIKPRNNLLIVKMFLTSKIKDISPVLPIPNINETSPALAYA